jgi:hypothetical protein
MDLNRVVKDRQGHHAITAHLSYVVNIPGMDLDAFSARIIVEKNILQFSFKDIVCT